MGSEGAAAAATAAHRARVADRVVYGGRSASWHVHTYRDIHVHVCVCMAVAVCEYVCERTRACLIVSRFLIEREREREKMREREREKGSEKERERERERERE